MQSMHGGDVYAHPGVLDFSANINPLPAPQEIMDAAAKGLGLLEQYPDPFCRELRSRIAQKKSCQPEQVICGNGAAELLYSLVLARKPKNALVVSPGFMEYERALQSVGAHVRHFMLQRENKYRLTGEYLDALTAGTDMAFLCSPNNPTGSLIDNYLMGQIVSICEKKHIFLVVDECFQDFISSPQKYTLEGAISRNQQLFLLKSFTKIYRLAGLRLGYGLCGDRELLERMNGYRQPWAVSLPAQLAGVVALEQEEYVRETRSYMEEQRKWMTRALRNRGYEVFEPSANYLFFQGKVGLQEKLLQRRILIRDCSNYYGLDRGYYRVAIRKPEENELLLRELDRISSR